MKAVIGSKDNSRLTLDINEQTINPAELEMSLRNGTLIEDCALLSRKSVDGLIELAAFVVPTLPYSIDRIEAYIQSKMPQGIRFSWVLVPALPLTEQGQVDESALLQLPVLDAALAQIWETRLNRVPGVGRAAIVIQEDAQEPPPLHLSDLLPGWKVKALQPDASTVVAQSGEKEDQVVKPRPPAFADGGPLTIPGDAPKTFTEALLRTAQKFPHKGLVHIRSNGEEFFQSYPQLLEEAKRILGGLQAAGLKPGDRVVLQCELLSDHFAAFWACVLGGITPVNVAVAPSYEEKNSIVNKLYNIWKLLKHPVVIASDHLVKPLGDLERFFPGDKFKVFSVEDLKQNPSTENIHDSKPDDLVFFQLTSGSTGVPKCIQESHRSVIAHIHGSAQFNGYTPDDVILNWLPVDHVVPTLTCNLKDVYMGCQEIQVATSVVISEPLRWLDLMETFQVTHSWAPNFGFKLVADRLSLVEDRKWDLSSVKFLMNAGEQVTLPVVSEFLKRTERFGITPVKMQPSFGMAEACTCMTYTNDFSLSTGVHRFLKSSLNHLLQPSAVEDASTITFIDLGPPVPGVQIRITDSHNQVVPEGKIGRFQIKGDVITRGYLDNEEANKDAFVGDGWFNSGDLGYIWNGRLALTGREKEMIIIRGANFYCYEIEDVVNALPGAQPTFSAAVSVSDPATGSESLAILFVPQKESIEEKVRIIEQIRKAVASNLGISPSFIVPLPKSEFCKTTSGKIQRNQMKKSLLAGQYDAALKEIDLALGNANTLPAWFYRKVWRRKEFGSQRVSASPGEALVFADSNGLGEHLCAELERREQSCIRVTAGSDFAKLNSNLYRIDAADPEQYSRLLSSIAEDGMRVGQVLHLFSYGDFSADWSDPASLQVSLNRGVFSLLFLTQALARLDESQRPSRLIVTSSNSQRVQAEDPLDSTRSTVLGLVKTIPQELSWLACSHIDLPGQNARADAEVLSKEALTPGTDREVAWRSESRWVTRLETVDFNNIPKASVPFKQGGLYVLTGGLGGIGVELARTLLQNFKVRLLILGRTPLAEGSCWADLLAKGDAQAERIRALQQLGSLGDVAYDSVDISDFAAVARAGERARARWNSEIDGIVHTAGLYQERQLPEETRESFSESLGAKVAGSVALHQLIKNRPGTLFISFASVYGFFGGFSIGAYSAANAFQESFAEWQRAAGIGGQCLAWSLWEETGMSRGFTMKQLSRARGYYGMSREQGIQSFLAAQHHKCGDMLIGLDASKPAIRRVLRRAAGEIRTVSAYFESRNGGPSDGELQNLSVEDRYQHATHCRFRRIERMPLTPSGEIDRLELAAQVLEKEAVKEPPQTEIERALAAVWTEVLHVNAIGRDDNFFDLGGHSLSAVQITYKIRRAFHVDFPLKNFLEAPVLSAQAQQLESQLLSQADASELEQFMDEIGPALS
jgi:acyl-CoA synthetase (AMP-forming)/AMP-acid ligase II/NAD(P)-dependent dehydrogenase (short-subunit alcohol dehydrogenase family)/acyl carrier protein